MRRGGPRGLAADCCVCNHRPVQGTTLPWGPERCCTGPARARSTALAGCSADALDRSRLPGGGRGHRRSAAAQRFGQRVPGLPGGLHGELGQRSGGRRGASSPSARWRSSAGWRRPASPRPSVSFPGGAGNECASERGAGMAAMSCWRGCVAWRGVGSWSACGGRPQGAKSPSRGGTATLGIVVAVFAVLVVVAVALGGSCAPIAWLRAGRPGGAGMGLRVSAGTPRMQYTASSFASR